MSQEPDISMDTAGLYREVNITDRRVGNIRCLTPININGEVDESRAILYLGQTQMMTNMGPMPLSFEIEADSLEQAVANFGDGAKQAIERTIEEAKELQRQQASQIVMPGEVPGGKIQIP